MVKLWVRDAMVWKTDLGANDGTLSIDLLWKARTGGPINTGPDPAAVPIRRFLPTTVLPDAVGAKPVDVHPDMRVPGADASTLAFDLLGARILRIRLYYGFIFSNPTPAISPDYEEPMNRGWYEGMMLAPFGHAASILPLTSAANPRQDHYAVAIDWLWWARKYLNQHPVRVAGFGGAATSTGVYSEVDTQNGRMIQQPGESLYWQISPSLATQSAPLVGATINGGVANWSILLEVPS